MKSDFLTEEQKEIAYENNIPVRYIVDRVNRYGWDIERAITEPVNKKHRKMLTPRQIRLTKAILSKYGDLMLSKGKDTLFKEIEGIIDRL